MKLVDEKVERDALVFGYARPLHCGRLKPRYEEGAEDVGRVGAELAFREISDEDVASVHDVSEVERAAGLAEDVSERWVCSELTDFV